MKKSLSLLKEELEEDANVNLTPLIDVVFVVLIMFILVAPLVEIDRINLAASGPENKADMTSFHDSREIKIHVYKDNTIWLNGVPLTVDELKIHLIHAYQLNPQGSPQIFHDREAYFGTYQSVKNAAEAAGFESLDVIIKSG